MSLLSLSNEILLEIAEGYLHKAEDLYSLVLTSRQLAIVMKQPLNRLVVQRDPYAQTALFYAAVSGDKRVLRGILENGPSMFVISDRSRLLHQVPGKVDAKVIERMLERAANLTIKKRLGKYRCWEGPALHWAARIGDEKMVELLLQKGANINAVKRGVYSALHEAATRGRTAAAGVLLKYGARVNLQGWGGETPVERALKYQHREVAKLLLQYTDDVSFQYQYQKRVIHLAAEAIGNDDTVMKSLLERGANIWDRDFEGRTALAAAAWAGHDKVVKVLVDNGAFDSYQTDHSPVILAGLKGHSGIQRLLLEQLPVNFLVGVHGGCTVLTLAVLHHDKEFVKSLLEHGANVNALSPEYAGRTALHAAAFRCRPDLVQLLLEHGADIKPPEDLVGTALHGALRNYQIGLDDEIEQVVKLLLDAGVDINAVDRSGRTALHLAAEYHNSDRFVALLVERGVNRTLRDRRRLTALGIAMAAGNRARIALLIDKNIRRVPKKSEKQQTDSCKLKGAGVAEEGLVLN